MLLEFRAKNFKSFQDELVFSMIPAPKQKGLDYSILKEKIGAKNFTGLSSAVIYGPNASGKTNVIGAMDVLRQIVLRGHIRNADTKSGANPAANQLELIPNKEDTEQTPVDFSIKFIDSDYLFEYKLSVDLGRFLEDEYKRSVLLEMLYVNEKLVFSRGKDLEHLETKVIKKYFSMMNNEEVKVAKKLAQNNLNSEELFLKNGFKAMFSSKLVGIIHDWFEDKFLVFCRADALQVLPSFSKKNTILVD